MTLWSYITLTDVAQKGLMLDELCELTGWPVVTPGGCF